MKSAYEAALERLETQGIERPREDALPEAVRAEMEAVRQKAQASLAELEILARDRMLKAGLEPSVSEDGDYLAERQRILDRRDRKLEALRSKSRSV